MEGWVLDEFPVARLEDSCDAQIRSAASKSSFPLVEVGCVPRAVRGLEVESIRTLNVPFLFPRKT